MREKIANGSAGEDGNEPAKTDTLDEDEDEDAELIALSTGHATDCEQHAEGLADGAADWLDTKYGAAVTH